MLIQKFRIPTVFLALLLAFHSQAFAQPAEPSAPSDEVTADVVEEQAAPAPDAQADAVPEAPSDAPAEAVTEEALPTSETPVVEATPETEALPAEQEAAPVVQKSYLDKFYEDGIEIVSNIKAVGPQTAETERTENRFVPDLFLGAGLAADEENGISHLSLDAAIRTNLKLNSRFLDAPDGLRLSGKVNSIPYRGGTGSTYAKVELSGRRKDASLNNPFSGRSLIDLSPSKRIRNSYDKYTLLHDDSMGVKLRLSREVGVEGSFGKKEVAGNSEETRFSAGLEAGVSIENNINDLFLIAKVEAEHERCMRIKKKNQHQLCGLLKARANAGLLRAGGGVGLGVEYRNLKFGTDLNRSIAGKRVQKVVRTMAVTSGVDMNGEFDRTGDLEKEAQFKLLNFSISLD